MSGFNTGLRKLVCFLPLLLILSAFAVPVDAQEACYQYRPSAGCCYPWGAWRADHESAWEEWKQRFNNSPEKSGCSAGRLYDIQSIVSKSSSPPYAPVYVTARTSPTGPFNQLSCGITWSRVCPAMHYVSPDPPPEAECGPSCNDVGDPINPASGAVTHSETDISVAVLSALEFRRHYNSADKSSSALGSSWRHSYSRRIEEVPWQWRYRAHNPTRDSPFYTSQVAACTTGFNQIKSQVAAWATATSTLVNGACKITHNGVYLGTLPIHFNDPLPPDRTWGTIGYNAIRDDGRRIHFSLQDGILVAPPGVTERLEKTSTGYVLLDSNDSAETYDTNGTLLSIRSRSDVQLQLNYDSVGRLIEAKDNFGHQIGLVYGTQGELANVTDAASNETHFQYDSQKKLIGVTHRDGSSREYQYQHALHPDVLTGLKDENGTLLSSWDYDSQRRAISTQEAGGANAVALVYNSNGSVTTTDALGAVRVFTFGRVGERNRITSISGSKCPTCVEQAATSYDHAGFVANRTDYNGIITKYVNDPLRGLQTSRTEAFGTARARTITTEWHATYHVPTQIDTSTGRKVDTHDAKGNVLTKTTLDTTTSESRTSTYTYNSFGQVLTADGPRTDVSDVTTYTYYTCTTGFECGQIQTITNALGHITTYNTYNAHGQPLTITDPNDVVTTLTYDLRQRLTSRTVGSELTSFDYWPTGLLKEATLPDGSYLEYTYDAAHRLTDINDSEGNRIHYTLDAMGNRTAEEVFDPSNALTQTRTRVFDTLNHLQQKIGAAGGPSVTTTFGYDNNGNQTDIDAPLGRSTDQTYDELNRLTQVTDPAGGITKYGYNALDQLISVTDPRNKVTTYTYNALGDLKQQISPDTGTTTNTYDSAGNLQTRTDARGKEGTYTYDALNRVTTLTYPDQTISYVYDTGTDQKGRLTQVSDNSGSTAWAYDAVGRVLSRQQIMSSITKSLGYAFDSAGRLQTMTLPSGNTIDYGYTDGKMTSLTLNGSTTILSNVLYQPFGPTAGWTWGSSTLSVREYDADGKITDLDSAGLKTYDYDDAFRITDITDATDPNMSQSYGYDLLDRLTNATGSSLNQSWTYDANGNRLTEGGSISSTYSVSTTSNRLNSVSGSLTKTYSYDAAGNITSDGTATFTYDNAGRMVSATKAGVPAAYSINALGQRVKKTVLGTSTYFVYDEAGHLVGEYDNSGALIQETVWLGDIPVALLKPNGSGVGVFYVHTDHLNTPRRISRPSDNAIVWRWDSDPFGTTAVNEDPDGDSTLFAYNLRFPGQYYDAESGLHYNYYRDYDPVTGRYVQSDPIGLRGGLNTYAYVKSNPLSRIDPFGLDDRAEPRPCIGCWPFPPPTTRPPGGWWEEEFAKDVWDGAKNIGKAIKDWCTDSAEECKQKCDVAYQTQISVCGMFRDKRARQQCYENAMALYSDCLAKCGRGESPEPGE